MAMVDSEAVGLDVPAAEGSRASTASGRCTTKYVLSRKGIYNPKVPQSWLQELRDYLGSRSADLDAILDWAERQTSEI